MQDGNSRSVKAKTNRAGEESSAPNANRGVAFANALLKQHRDSNKKKDIGVFQALRNCERIFSQILQLRKICEDSSSRKF